MLHVAFLRNVNQGRPGHPSTSDIAEAFASAGCDGARTFQSNGTVVFASADPRGVMDVVLADPVLVHEAAHRRCAAVDSGHGWVPHRR